MYTDLLEPAGQENLLFIHSGLFFMEAHWFTGNLIIAACEQRKCEVDSNYKMIQNRQHTSNI